MNRDNVDKLFRNPPKITCRRIILRPMKRSDSDDMYEYARREDLTEYLLWEPHPDRDYTYRYLSYVTTRYKSGDFHDFAVVSRSTGKMIGTCGFTSFDFNNNSAEIGYVLNPDYRGHEIALEAVRAVLKIAFEMFGAHRVEARFMQGNDASRRVAEKAGMRFEGIKSECLYVKGRYVSVGTCGMTFDDYIRLYKG